MSDHDRRYQIFINQPNWRMLHHTFFSARVIAKWHVFQHQALFFEARIAFSTCQLFLTVPRVGQLFFSAGNRRKFQQKNMQEIIPTIVILNFQTFGLLWIPQKYSQSNWRKSAPDSYHHRHRLDLSLGPFPAMLINAGGAA